MFVGSSALLSKSNLPSGVTLDSTTLTTSSKFTLLRVYLTLGSILVMCCCFCCFVVLLLLLMFLLFCCIVVVVVVVFVLLSLFTASKTVSMSAPLNKVLKGSW